MTSSRPARSRRLASLLIALVTISVMLVPPVSLPGATAQSDIDAPPSGEVIVVLEENVATDMVTAAGEVSGVEPDAVFTEVFDGFATTVTEAEAEALAGDPNVAAIYPN